MPALRHRVALAAFAVAVLGAVAPSPAGAFRVFLDHNLDGDLSTFSNVVEGVQEAPITFVVAFGPEDSARTEIAFDLEWDCHADGSGFAVPHGDVGWAAIPDHFPFVDCSMDACLSLFCNCNAARVFHATLSSPVTYGFYEFTTLVFARFEAYSPVQFRLVCGQCDYLPGDGPATVMTFLGPVPNEAVSWGRVKSGYR